MAGGARARARVGRAAARAVGRDFFARGRARRREKGGTAMSTPAERVPFSCARLGLVAGNTFLEAVRQKLFNFLVLLAVGMVAGTRFFSDFNFGASELKFIFDFGMGALVFFGSALTITV